MAEKTSLTRRAFDQSGDYVYTVAIENGHPTTASYSAGCGLVTGYQPEEYAEDPVLWYKIIYENDRDAVIEQADAVLTGKPVPPLVYRIVHKDGRIRWIKNAATPRYDVQKRLVAYDAVVSALSERIMQNGSEQKTIVSGRRVA
jgi:PAS domain S-box-containing protein